jgi:hypothetical protein
MYHYFTAVPRYLVPGTGTYGTPWYGTGTPIKFIGPWPQVPVPGTRYRYKVPTYIRSAYVLRARRVMVGTGTFRPLKAGQSMEYGQ